ncbi:MAG: extracellular solute-binding protein [Clostridia bacterium]|nr:extracellular solute-binding protein [Clostridia bacterium]
MKSFVKILALILAVVMILPVLASCESDENVETEQQGEVNQTTETQTEEVTEAKPNVAENDYGSDFYLSIYEGSNPMKYYWVEESENDVMSQALFARQEKVREYLGVNIVGTPAGTYKEYADPFKTSVKNKDGSVDTLLSHVYESVASFVSENYLADIADYPGINVEADYWNADFMESISVAGKYYLGFSDFNILYTHVITFNKKMMEQYADSMEKSVYDLVRDYEWTIDEMISLANLVYVDATADGKTTDDTFGISGRQWNETTGFLHGCNINIIEPDESGAYTVCVMNEKNSSKTSQLVDKLYELSKSNCCWFDYQTTTENSVPLTSGRTLMHISVTNDLITYLDYDVAFGVLPYPMFDTAQKDVGYRHLQWGGYICVPSFVSNQQMVGETLDVLSFYSQDVKTAYYEKMLGKQVADVPDDSAMLEIVWDTVCTEFAQTYANVINTEMLYMMARVTHANAYENLASYVASRARTVDALIKKYMNKMEVIN